MSTPKMFVLIGVPLTLVVIGGVAWFRWKPHTDTHSSLRVPSSTHAAPHAAPHTDPAGHEPNEEKHSKTHTATVRFHALYSKLSVCQSVEYAGNGPLHTKTDPEDWQALLKTYHDLKGEIASWIKRHPQEKNTAELIEKIENLRIQRAPTLEEPDLTWRGLSVLSTDHEQRPIVRIGGGFLELYRKQPKRARFELARSMVQVFALTRATFPSLCVETHSADDELWAISSLIAREIAPPDCELPVLKSDSAKACFSTPVKEHAHEEHAS